MSRHQRGFTYLVLLFMVAGGGLTLAFAGERWATEGQRAREAELLFVGEQFRRAIALYYYRTPGPVRRYPAALEDLLEDARYPGTQRYLRRIYRDPMTVEALWGLLRAPDGGIAGVHSLSTETPLKTAAFPRGLEAFAEARTYACWRFEFVPVEETQGTGRAR